MRAPSLIVDDPKPTLPMPEGEVQALLDQTLESMIAELERDVQLDPPAIVVERA
jgi:hypothetical protein